MRDENNVRNDWKQGRIFSFGKISLRNQLFLAENPFTAQSHIHPALLNFFSHQPPLRSLQAGSQTQLPEERSRL